MTNLLELLSDFPEAEYAAGETLIEEGQPFEGLFVLKDGEVEVSREGVGICKISRAGSTFGEMSALLDELPSASVRATRNSKVVVVENALEFLRENSAAALDIARLLAYRVNWVTMNFAHAKAAPSPEEVRAAMSDSFAKRIFEY